MATVYSSSSCAYLSGDNLLEDAVISYVEETDSQAQHIKLTYRDGQAYPGTDTPYNLTVEVFCDPDNVLSSYTVNDLDPQ